MFAVPSFFGYNTTFVNGPVATAATGVGETSFTANWDAFTGATYYLLDVSTSPSFSSFVLQDEFTTSTSYVVIGLTASTTYYYRVRANVGVDPDAQAFFDRVTTAGGTLSATEQTATNQLVLDMKAAGIWTKMKAVYPMVGASAAACAQNLKSSSFTGSFTSGWTFASTGVTPNGTSAYMDSSLIPNNALSLNSQHLSFYSRTNSSVQSCLFGATHSTTTSRTQLIPKYNTQDYSSINFNPNPVSVSYTANAFFILNQTTSTSNKLYRNSTIEITRTNNTTENVDRSLYISARNDGIAIIFDNKECAFASIGDGLTDTQASNFYTAVQTFNQTLSRSVGPQIVSDADAQAYINRVYTAGGTLTNTEANAVNQLTIDMKAAGIWTAMKAVYPMVGSSAAACAQNLKSSSFTGTFTSGWTFASTGVTGNGTSAYFDTGLNANTNLTLSTNHYSYYSRTSSVAGVTVEMGVFQSAFVHLRAGVNYVAGGVSSLASFTTTATAAGFWLGSKTANNSRKAIYNGSVEATSTVSDTTAYPNLNIYIEARNDSGTAAVFSDKQCAFASIGDGLTDTQAGDFYTCVQTFNTTLSRQV